MSITTKQMKKIILASMVHLPELIEGKVCVFENGYYSLLNPSKYTSIEEGFDPMNYAILIHPMYSKCIVYSSKSDKVNYLVNQKYNNLLNTKKVTLYRIGDKIHIHSRGGIYEIISIFEDTIEITCKKWQYEEKKSIVISKKDFKCLAGGRNNYAE